MSTRVLIGLFGGAPPSVDPARTGSTPATPAAQPSPKRSVRIGRIVLLLAVLAVGAALWIWRPLPALRSAWRSLPIPAVVSEVVSSKDEVPKPEAATQAEAPPAAASQTARAARAAAAPPASIAAVQSPSEHAGGAEIAGPSFDPLTAAPLEAASDTETAPPAVAVVEPAPALPATPVRETRASASTRIYSRADSDVTPPKVIGGGKLGGLVGAIEPGTTVTIDFVISENGFVESAKGRTSPRTLGESLLLATGLHAIKSWRYRPAQKNGETVRFSNSISFGAY